MADRDWYYHHVMPKWRSTARRIERGDDAARVGDLAVKAFAKYVRAAGGVAGLEAFVQIVCNANS